VTAAGAHTLAAAAREMTFGANHESSAGVEVKQEESLGQLRYRKVLASQRAAVPGPRAPFVHIKVEDSSSGGDSEGEGGGGDREDGGEVKGEEKEDNDEDDVDDDEEEEAEPRPARARARRQPQGRQRGGPPSEPAAGSALGARVPAGAAADTGRLADNAIQDNDVQQQEEEEASLVPELAKRVGVERAGTSQFEGVSWVKTRNKWRAGCERKHLGFHTSEEGAARAYSKYLKDGSVPEPAERGPPGASQFKGVHWCNTSSKLQAVCKGNRLGYHATEEEAARVYIKYLEDGIDPVKHREASTSQFTGVCWIKNRDKWEAKCKGKHLGYHTTEDAAARAYNVEAGRVGRPLNVIPPAGAAGAGAGPGPGAGGSAGPKLAASKTPAAPTTKQKTKRAAPTTPAAPALSKKMKL